MKKISLMLMAFGLVATSCTKDEFDTIYGVDPHADFEKQFRETFTNIDPDNDWGFGATMKGVSMRAAQTWTDNHSDDWFEKLDFELPESYKTLTASDNTLRNGDVYYVPADFSGTINFDNFNGDVYVAAEITNFWGNPGKVNVYVLEGGAWKKGTTAGSLTIYNQGTVELGPWDLQAADNIPVIYNGGTLNIGNVNNGLNISDQVKIYSTKDITLYSNSTIDLKCSLDIHGTVKVPTGNLKVQNNKTQHVCGISVAGTLDVTQGKLESSYITADYIKFDGASIWLTEGGHIKANTIYMPNSATYIYGETNSVGLIEVTDITMGNQNFFDKVFSANIYFKIDGNIKFENSSVWDGTWTASTYVTDTEDGQTVAKRMNAGDATGNPACGSVWTVGTPNEEEPGDDPVEEPEEDPNAGFVRIIAEDLGAATSDFDYNDVVFDAKIVDGVAIIRLRAAGGTLPLYVAGKEVHEVLKVGPTTMFNTTDIDYDFYEEYTVPVTYTEVVDIPVTVYKEDGTELKLESVRGKYAEKLAVGTDYKWTNERESITSKYPKFNDYVSNKEVTDWYKR